MSSTIDGKETTQAAMKRGVPQRQAVATTTKPVSTVKVGG